MALAAVPSTDEIVRLYKLGELPAELAKLHEKEEPDEDPFLHRCVSLHNAGEIDLLALPSQAAFAELSIQAFFTAQNFYCKAIPDLNCNVSSLMECCRILVEKAGNDLAANMPNGAFRTWCERNPSKSAGVIQDAHVGEALAKRFVTFSLEAANDVDGAINFIKSYADDRRLSGIVALGRMKFSDRAVATRAIAALEPYVAKSQNDHVRINALLAAFGVLGQYNDAAVAQRLIEEATKETGPESLHGLARILLLHHAMLETQALKDILTALEKVDPQHLGTINDIDIGLRQLLGTKNEPLALDYLTAILRHPKHKLQSFQVVAHELTNGDQQRLYELVVRWLLSGSIELCNNVSNLVGLNKERLFNTTAQPLQLTETQQVFLCRKAIGFLFLKPVICCSIIVSVLRLGNKKLEDPIADLLFDTVLLSYAGEAKDYLNSILPTDTAYGAIKKALIKDNEFFARLKAVGIIKELHPSDYQQDVVHQGQFDEMQKVRKLAESKSPLLSMVHRSTILYGKRSLTYVNDPDGSQRPVEVDLKTFGASFEVPRRDIFDPVGLNYVLSVFRAEKLK